MLKRVSYGFELEEGVSLTEEQQERFEEIQYFPAEFMPDYEAYITDGSMPPKVDEEGNKRNLAKHPMRDIEIESRINEQAAENHRLKSVNERLLARLNEKEVITKDDKEYIEAEKKEDDAEIKR